MFSIILRIFLYGELFFLCILYQFTHWAPSSQGDEVTDEENIQNDKTVDTENATSEAADIEASGKTVERGATQESDLSKANDETVVDKGNAKEKRKPEKIVNSQQTHSNSSKANTPGIS